MTSPQDLFSFDIGLVDGRSRLNCCINLHEKSFRYYKSRKVLITFDPALRLKRWAFAQLRRHAFPYPQSSEGVFLPGELFRGNLSIMPAFLQQLRSQKVESFIHLHLHHHNHHNPCIKLTECLNKIVQTRRSECFRLLLESVHGPAADSRQNQSRFARKDRKGVDTTHPGRTNHSADTPRGRNSRSLSITYTRIDLSERKYKRRTTDLHQEKNKKTPVCVSIKRLEAVAPRKMYMFDSVEQNWNKRTPPKATSSSQF